MLNTYCLSKTILFCQNRYCFKTGGTSGSFGIYFQQIWFGVYVVYISRYGNYGYDCGNNTLPNSKKENRNKICGEKLKNNIKIKPCGQKLPTHKDNISNYRSSSIEKATDSELFRVSGFSLKTRLHSGTIYVYKRNFS